MTSLLVLVLAQAKYYVPEPNIQLKGSMLTFAQHDERYQSLGKGLYVLHWKVGKGELLYIGTQHTKDPADAQFILIEQYWDAFNPDIAFYEGRGPNVQAERDRTIQSSGEPGLVLFMSKRDQKDVWSFEPTMEDEVAPLLDSFDKKDIVLKLVLSGYYSDRRGGAVADWRVALSLARRQKQYGFGEVFKDLASLDAYWNEKYGALGEWRTAEESVQWPGVEHTTLNAIANASNRVRDEHMMRTIVDLMRKGKRALIVVGRSHVLNQEPVLQETLQPQEFVFTSKKPWDK